MKWLAKLFGIHLHIWGPWSFYARRVSVTGCYLGVAIHRFCKECGKHEVKEPYYQW